MSIPVFPSLSSVHPDVQDVPILTLDCDAEFESDGLRREALLSQVIVHCPHTLCITLHVHPQNRTRRLFLSGSVWVYSLRFVNLPTGLLRLRKRVKSWKKNRCPQKNMNRVKEVCNISPTGCIKGCKNLEHFSENKCLQRV